ncbi:hypothetical protein GCM10017600_82860 [Streptosporangium carneum]|uniref:Uncharacterized protein n=1 Tax=Streptosporangium carneum TaxID=47481 RepID=A0A9W6IBY0_9ACTN|nr:hypothetical protein GCM10017600_82860 [Streptosporangium carneum]
MDVGELLEAESGEWETWVSSVAGEIRLTSAFGTPGVPFRPETRPVRSNARATDVAPRALRGEPSPPGVDDGPSPRPFSDLL